MHHLYSQVADAMRNVAREVILPYYGKLASGDVFEKSPGELVTTVDVAAEAALCASLKMLLPDATVVGEESCAKDHSLLKNISSDVAWIVDPLDGTSNFAAGVGSFGIIIALAEKGVTQAGWLYDPVTDVMSHAALGRGAYQNRLRVQCSPTSRRPIASCATRFLDERAAAALLDAVGSQFQLVPIPLCAAEHYPRLVRGQDDLAIFQRSLPWDHAAGVLFLKEAGGVVSCWDGSPYRLSGGGDGIIAGVSEEAWRAGFLAIDAAGLGDGAPALKIRPNYV